jgi:hypothetical protein
MEKVRERWRERESGKEKAIGMHKRKKRINIEEIERMKK